MNDIDQHLTDDDFDALAREAGASLRRPAPADGVARIQTSRRRQQTLRVATGAMALVAIVAAGAFVATRNDDAPALVIQPDGTSVPATTVVPGTTVVDATPTTGAPATIASTVAPATVPLPTELSDDARAWVDARLAEGHTQVSLTPDDGSGFRLLNTLDAVVPARGAVLLADGRVVDTPTVALGGWYSLGGKPAIVQVGLVGDADPTSQVWVLDPATEEWTSTGDLGLPPIDPVQFGSITVRGVGDRLIVADNAYVDAGDGSYTLSPDQRGVVVDADLAVTDMAPAPEGVALSFTSSSGGKALQMYAPAIEGGNGLDVVDDQPWQYDPVSNEWSEIPIPEWFDCPSTIAGTCPWVTVPDIGAIRLESATSRGLVARVPDGTVGLYDATSSTWTRMDDAPFELAMPTVAVVGDQVVVAPWRSGTNDFSQIGVLDVASGSWSTTQVDIPSDVTDRFDTEWFDVTWNLRVAGTRVMAAPGPSFQPTPIDPIAVYDTATRTWGEPTDDDVDVWQALDPYLVD